MGRTHKVFSGAAAALTFLGASATATSAHAQQATFHLDRLEMPGAPDDGAVLFRPVTQPKAIFYGQLGIGYQRRPLHTDNIIGANDRSTRNLSSGGVIDNQFSTYFSAGFQFFDRFTVGATLPVAWIQNGQNPVYSGAILSTNKTTAVQTGGPSMGDTRIDLRSVLHRSPDRNFALGAQLSVFAPTGNGSNANFGGDGGASALLLVNGEYTWRFLTFVANTGVHIRPTNSINDPNIRAGLGIGNEWRWSAGAFIPIKDKKGVDRIRLGATIFGQTGIDSSTTIGETLFTKRNTPIEYHFEARIKFGPSDRFWAGGGAGGRILNGYGAPDFRILGLVGMYVPILDSVPVSPKQAMREKWREQRGNDADHDGIPDDIDACPTEPEDHLGSDTSDGCPQLPDRDGDGIPDAFDKCPDVAEDKDGIDDADGCPEDDFDKDGVPDVTDACPKEPGPPNKDTKINGCPTTFVRDGEKIRIFQQVHFATGSATILPDSFPMLQEIANLLKVNASIKKMAIEGHTDNRGDAGMNLRLSQSRSESVMNWIVAHAVEGDRLEAHGYGLTKPIEPNETDAGRLANRRVEFKIILEDDGSSKPPSKGETP